MSHRSSDLGVTYRPAVYATQEEADAARASALDALKELARAIARADFKRNYKELMETGRCRTMSLDPNVDWEKHDAEWAAYDAAMELEAGAKRKRRSRT